MDETLSSLLQSLVRIDSVNPSLVPGGAGEAQIAGFIQGWLIERGIPAELDEAAPGRLSVIARVKGTRGGPSLMLNAHIDTVGVAGMTDPWSGVIRNGRLYGRGAYDMKAGLSACLLALVEVRDARLGGDVVLTAVCDEEHASIGVQSVLKRVTADAAIVTEPTELQVVVAHKGFSWHEISTRGKAAHGSRPDLGVDAIAHMGRVLNRLETLQAEFSRGTRHPLLGYGSLHASLITGGQELSSYPETCTLLVERRTLPGETGEAVAAQFRQVLEELAAADPQFAADYKTTLVRPPFSISAEASLVTLVHQEASSVLGRQAIMSGSTPWMDAAFTAEAGIPTVVIGPSGAGAHAIEEWVDLESVDQCRRILVGAIQRFCR